ncbi:MAG: hypothetical protein K9M75_01775 [Phycisphaerae bacterium]|nr:hypothetical protein [Phycisphaerae bacterium]
MDDFVTIDQETDAVVEAVADGRVDNGIAKRNCLIFILAVVMIAGFLYGIGPVESDPFSEEVLESDYMKPVEFASGFIITFAALAWCLFDAEERNFKFSRKCSICFVLIPYITFPWYILTVRKGMACLKVFAGTVLFGGLYFLAMGLGYACGMVMSGIL